MTRNSPPPPTPNTGLCDSCVHQKVVRNTRGSAFSMCLRSRTEPDRFPKYPPLPVRACVGYCTSAGSSRSR